MHTKGPWKIEDLNTPTPCIVAEQGKKWDNPIVCHLYEDTADNYDTNNEYESFENYKANAKLIAAAPEMLEVCKAALADLEGIIPEFEPSGDRQHPAWKTIQELQQTINKALDV